MQHTYLCSCATLADGQEAKNVLEAIIRQTVDMKHSIRIGQTEAQQRIPIIGSSADSTVSIDAVRRQRP